MHSSTDRGLGASLGARMTTVRGANTRTRSLGLPPLLQPDTTRRGTTPIASVSRARTSMSGPSATTNHERTPDWWEEFPHGGSGWSRGAGVHAIGTIDGTPLILGIGRSIFGGLKGRRGTRWQTDY